MCTKEEMWTAQELQEEADIRDQLDAERAHQQALDEQQELLSEEERKEELLWRLELMICDAVKACGKGKATDAVVAALEKAYENQVVA